MKILFNFKKLKVNFTPPYIYECEMKSSQADVISAVDVCFDLWDPNTEAPIKKCVDSKKGLC